MIPPLTKESRLYFGKKHYGSQLKNVPSGYLLWIYKECHKLPLQLKKYIEENKAQLEAEKKKMNKILYR